MLHIEPDFDKHIYEGTVSIQIEVEKETNLIVLHSKDLEIEGISILNMMARMRIAVKNSYLSEDREMLFIELYEIIYTATAYVVSISFVGKMNGLSGIYSSSYLNEDGTR